MNSQKIVIDTDPGIDDAMAIFYACFCDRLEVVGLTSVFGNVTTEVATRNALVLGDILDTPIPVAAGSTIPLVQAPNAVSDYVHGTEGFGDIPAQKTNRSAIDCSAAEYICRTINGNPGEIILCPIGPLTNIAHALRLDPSIASKVRSIVIMGGGLYSGGNVTNYAEANIWNDPHAANEVFAADWEVTVVGLDVTQKVVCPHSHDPVAVIATVYPEYFKYEYHPIEIDLSAARSGATVISKDTNRRPAKIAVDVDVSAIKENFFQTLRKGF